MENINIEKVIYKWFEMTYQTYDNLEHDDSIYLYYEGERYAEIRIDKKSKFIDYNWKFYEEFSEIIHIERNVFQGFMSKWVEDTFNLKGFTTEYPAYTPGYLLKIPKLKK